MVAISIASWGSLEGTFPQGIEDNDRYATARGLMQRAHHARMIRAGIVSHGDDELAAIEIVQ
jgi:hypothetical protein